MTSLKIQKKYRARHYGVFAESLCAWYLRFKGYRILKRGYRVHAGEIDIIARRRNLIAFIEVKARSNFTSAAEALGKRQQNRIIRAAGAFIQSNPKYLTLNMRFDVMLVQPRKPPIHLTNAWFCEEK